MEVKFGTYEDIDSWMKLVNEVSWNFPGLEDAKGIEEHKNTVLRFMDKKQAICVKENNEIIAVTLFSRNRNMICCLAVSPAHRRKGLATLLIQEIFKNLDQTKDITVTTFREEDPKGKAPRALYRSFGFVEGELVTELNYPNQVFILHPQR